MTVHNFSQNTTQNSSDNLPSYLQTNITAQMLSIRGEGEVAAEILAESWLRQSVFNIKLTYQYKQILLHRKTL